MYKKSVTEISNNIRDIRKAKGIKQTELAAAIGVAQGRIAEYETGKRSVGNITLDTALRIAQALGSTIDEVFTKTIETVESEYKFGIFGEPQEDDSRQSVNISLSAQKAAQLKQAAAKAGMTVSAYIESLIV